MLRLEILWTFMSLIFIASSSGESYLKFETGREYIYSYSGNTEIEDAGLFKVTAQLGLEVQNDTKSHRKCRLHVHNFNFYINHEGKDKVPENMKMDFTKWFLFDLTPHGEVTSVEVEKGDDPIIVNFKKTFVATISARLHFSEEKIRSRQRWGYQINETGQDGVHVARYDVTPKDQRLTFTKTKTGNPHLKTADARHEKIIEYGTEMGLPMSVTIKEHFSSPDEVMPGYTPDQGRASEIVKGQDIDIPAMKASSVVSVKYMTQRPSLPSAAPPTLVNSTLKVDKAPIPVYPLEKLLEDINGNFSCMIQDSSEGSTVANKCYLVLLNMLRHLGAEDLTKYARQKISILSPHLSRKIMVDALGGLGTKAAIQILVDRILKAPSLDPALIMHTLLHVTKLREAPPIGLLNELELRVFSKPYAFPDLEVTQQVNGRAYLVLGSIAEEMRRYDAKWAIRIINKLETNVGIHDPWEHRTRRESMDQSDFTRYLRQKSIHILALGNAASPSSVEHLASYLNTTDTHSALRRSALKAVGQYDTEEAAEMILTVAIADENVHVRREAFLEYLRHPRAVKLDVIRQAMGVSDPDIPANMTSNIDHEEHRRFKRSLGHSLSRIWKGFDFKLQTPKVNWAKMVGSKKIGASFGVIFQNLLDLSVHPLKGHLIVDVLDKAWVTAHLGILGFDYHLFKAELCFRGDIKYDLNMLAEYSFPEAKRLADLYDKVVDKVVGLVKNSVKRFKYLVSTVRNTDFSDIFKDLVESLRNLPKQVFNLRRLGRRLWRALGQYHTLPPVVEKIKALIRRVTALFNDIKTDVMRFYNAIADAVTVTLPWAAKQIKEAFKLVVQAIKKLVRSPKKAIQDIGKGVGRVYAAIGGVLAAKERIEEASLFKKENRPYWFDLKTVFKKIWDDVLAVKKSVQDTIKWLSQGQSADDVAKKFTGISLTQMKKQALDVLMQVILEELEGPITHLKRLAEPFLLAYDTFTLTVKDVKEAFTTLKNGYGEARTLIEQVFGPKLDPDFYKKYLESESCGNGFYPSTGKANYKHEGVDLEAQVDAQVVMPFRGIVKVTGHNQVTIKVSRMKDVEVILENVKVGKASNGEELGSGDELGVVTTPQHCSDSHIHFSMRKTTKDGGYIDPSRYMEKRPMPTPKWVQHCDNYVLIWLGETISEGSLTDGPKTDDETPQLENNPDMSDLPEVDSEKGKRSLSIDNFGGFQDFIDKAKDFTKKLGLPDMSSLGPLFKFQMKDITVKKAFDIMSEFGMHELRAKFEKILRLLKENLKKESCIRPDAMDDDELRSALIRRGRNSVGARETLIQRYLEPDQKCFGIRGVLTPNVYCKLDDNCLGVSCCFDLKLFIFRRSLNAFVRYDPCNFIISIGVGSWVKNIEIFESRFAFEDSIPIVEDSNVFDNVQLILKYKITRSGNKIVVSVSVGLCSTKVESCMGFLKILDKAELQIPACNLNSTSVATRTKRSLDDFSDLLDLKMDDLEKLLDLSDLADDLVSELLQKLRDSYKEIAQKAIDAVLAKIFGDDFKRFDMCAEGFQKTFGPYHVTFFNYVIPIPLGPFILYFEFGAGGNYGARFRAGLCVLSMKATATITPSIGAHVYGAVGLQIAFFKGELRLTGYLLTTSFPTKAIVEFKEFPLVVRVRMDIVMVPLRLVLRAYLKFELKISLPWGKKICICYTIVNIRLWHYSSPAIRGTIFNYNDAEPDNSPPDFSIYDVPRKEDTEPDNDDTRRRRALATVGGVPHCKVKQIEQRDWTEPAFNIELRVGDDRSQVTLTYCVGRFRGGCDVINHRPLGGDSSVVEEKLRGGIPLYFTVTARNNAGKTSQTTCYLPTYDVTIPLGRVTTAFTTTSHPNIVRASAIALDDSVLDSQREAVGYGRGIYGDQLFPYDDVSVRKQVPAEPKTDDPLGLHLLKQFGPGRSGRVISIPVTTSRFQYAEACARLCLSYSETKCASFNYDYGNQGTCEILEVIEGHGFELHASGKFHNFERIGVGHMAQFEHKTLNMTHFQLLYVNFFVNNTLGYTNVLNSKPVLSDFTPPTPAVNGIQNAKQQGLDREKCEDILPKEWESKCAEQSPIENHRFIIDGEGSRTVFNGPNPLTEELYTRANKMLAANWDGIHDNETGLHGYTWSAGTHFCKDDIHPHRDPHAHLFDESDWTHVGIAFPLSLKDGLYHVTVRAVNKVEFGGPGILSVCHSTPYAIDTTPPLIHFIGNHTYDENTFVITVDVNASDPLSKIREIDFGLGKTSRDTYLLDWQRQKNYTHVIYKYQIPDGIPAWIKIRAINNVDLRTSGHASYPIVVDISPPEAGDVFDGPHPGHDLKFQSDNTSYCANWRNFFDPQSGISKYRWGVGTSPGLDDVIAFRDKSHTVTNTCHNFKTEVLKHNTKYFSTLTAYNGGHARKNITVSSNGVRIDLTPPVEGYVKDGAVKGQDIRYSSEAASVGANWDGYTDPESGIRDYRLSVYKVDKVNGSDQLIHDAERVMPDKSSILWHHFHLKHGDTIKVKLNATNNAEASTVTETDGFTIDLTDPKMVHLGDGDAVGKDRMYSSSTTTLKANWKFVDPESGVDHYKVSVYETRAGIRQQIYPAANAFDRLPGQVNGWTSKTNLNLVAGSHYSIRVTTVNGARLSSVHDTTGVTIDPTAPDVVAVHVGVLSGESEELHDGFVVLNDELGIQASWLAVDPESGVEAYWVAVGTSPGASDIRAYTNMGSGQDGYIKGLNLTLTNPSTNKPVYYVSVKATNGAGMMSSKAKTSNPIKIVPGDVTGVIYDGPEQTDTSLVDIDAQLDGTLVTAQFEGFESAAHGIARYEWGVGTKPRTDDVMTYTSFGIVLVENHTNIGEGVSGRGHGQAILPLQHGQTYFASFRAITGARNVLDSSSDGVVIDTTPPKILLEGLGVGVNISTPDVSYQKSVDSLSASWDIREQESGLNYATFRYGTYPGSYDIFSITNTDGLNNIPSALVTPDKTGKPNILTLSATNKVGRRIELVSKAVVVDSTPPVAGSVVCPKYAQGGDTIACAWSGFYDGESGIDGFKFSLGTQEGAADLYPLTPLPASHTKHLARGFLNGGLKHQGKYYATVIAVNKLGQMVSAFSSPIVVDDTPPKGGVVIELPGVEDINATISTNQTSQVLCQDPEDCKSHDAVCQRSLTQVGASWEAFQDDETEITRYEVALGTNPGGSQLKAFSPVPTGQRHVVIRNVDLSNVKKVYVSVKGYNGAGLYSVASSNGVFISRVSSGLTPLGTSYVNDGDTVKKDMSYQDYNDRLSGHWDFSGDPCPVEFYEWSLLRVDGAVVLPMTRLPAGQTKAATDELRLKDGETFFIVVRATNVLGFTYSLHSNGVTVQLEPLLPGRVRDGDVIGFDLNYQASITQLSANWDDFGKDKKVDSVPNGENGNIGQHQVIDHYEVALGTDRRYPRTRTNVHPFVNIGLNTTWTFLNLNLIPKTSVYYTTVRAFSVSGSMAEVTSNGIQVGYGGRGIAIGKLNLPRYIASTTDLKFSWKGFLFAMPVLFYQWGMGTNSNELDKLTCTQLQNFESDGSLKANANYSHLFDKKELSNVAKDTYIEATGLKLAHKGLYHVVVIATDESAECLLASGTVSVDTTGPLEGKLHIGDTPADMTVMYTSRSDQITVKWKGYSDPESSIAVYHVALYEASQCVPGSGTKPVVDFIELNGTYTQYTFVGLDLKSAKSYFIHLRATNGAGLNVNTTSPPILVDLTDPTFGKVKDGADFSEDVDYQSSTSELTGTFLYLPNKDGVPCPSRVFSLSQEDSQWKSLTAKRLSNTKFGKTVAFRPSQVRFDAQNGLTLTMSRDVQEKRMLSGALYTKAEIGEGGKYKIDIKTASGNISQAVTSLVFWDGPDGTLGDRDIEITDQGAEFTQRPPVTPKCTCPNATVHTENGTAMNTTNCVNGSCPCICDSTTEAPTTEAATTESPTTKSGVQGGGLERRPIEEILPTQKAYGLQFQSRAGKNYAVLWFRSENGAILSSGSESILLNFDPSAAWHTYELVLNVDKSGSVTEFEWSIELLIDGSTRGVIYGAPTLSSKAKLVLSVWNRDGWVPEVNDIFNVPTVKAYFKNIRMPPASSAACRYGNPFRGGDNAIVKFEAGVGSSRNQANLVPYKQVSAPCIPCSHPCDQYLCQLACNANTVQKITVKLTNLDLRPYATEMVDGNTTAVPGLCYLTIKAITGSGRQVVASSDGVYLDVTPPVIEELFNIDVNWKETQPIMFQSSNSTIAVQWIADDKETQVTEFKWAIGLYFNDTSIQPFTSAARNTSARNSKLLGVLKHNQTYYTTLMATNRAGLTAYKSSEVKVLLKGPDFSKTKTIINNTEPFANVTGAKNILRSNKQDSIGVGWERPEGEEMAGVFLRAGSTKGKDDIVPVRQVGFNDSGTVLIEKGKFIINGGPAVNISDVQASTNQKGFNHTRNNDQSDNFKMEPGRTIYMDVEGCNPAHKCSSMQNKAIVIVRDQDSVATSHSGSAIDIKLTSSSNFSSPKQEIEIQTKAGQKEGTTLTAGNLSPSDVKQHYGSDASPTFKSYIVDPQSTIANTDRALMKRVKKLYGPTFYVNTLPKQSVDGSLWVTAPFDKTDVELFMKGFKPRILYWHTDSQKWRDAYLTCPPAERNMTYNWDEGMVSVTVCETQVQDNTVEQQSRRKRASPTGSYSGATQFAVASVNQNFVNTPPKVTSGPTVSVFEDQPLIYILTASDAENDKLIFLLNTSVPLPLNGTVTLDRDSGRLTYKNCLNCNGKEEVHFTVIEKRFDDKPALSVDSVLYITVLPVNDFPELLFTFEGAKKEKDKGSVDTVSISVEQNNASNIVYSPYLGLVAAYDIDSGDDLRFSYEAPKNGRLTLDTSGNTSITFTEQDCSLPWQNRSSEWSQVYAELAKRPSNVQMPYPCNFQLRHAKKRYSWAVTLFKYEPNEGFYGKDQVKVLTRDQAGAPSRVLTIDIFVLANPCTNNATCAGSVDDPSCSSYNRSQGFDGYNCTCLAGFVGNHCQTEIDECLSSPCAENFTCIDLVDGYTCYCGPDWPCQTVPWPNWLIGLLVALGGLLVIFFAMCAGYFIYKKDTQKRQTPQSSVTSDPSYPESFRALVKTPPKHRPQTNLGNPLYGDFGQFHPDGKVNQQFANPAYTENYILEEIPGNGFDTMSKWLNHLKTDSSHQFYDDRDLYSSLPGTADNGAPDAANAEIKLPRPHVDPGPHRKYKKRDDHHKY